MPRPFKFFLQVVLVLGTLLLCPFAARAVSYGDPNPPVNANNQPLYPADTPDNLATNPNAPSRVDHNVASSPFAGVAYLSTHTDNRLDGTATVLDAYHILTAAHVVVSAQPSDINIFVQFDNEGTDSIYPHASIHGTASAININPVYNLNQPNDAGDIAIITLSSPLPDYVPRYGLYTAPLKGGDVVTIVGYGQSGDGVHGYYNLPNAPASFGPTKRVGYNNLDGSLAADGLSYTSYAPYQSHPVGDQVYLFDFDAPGPGGGSGYVGGASLGNQYETTIGVGDSGSPAFIYTNGQYLIAGVNDFDTASPDNSRPAGFFGAGGGGAIISANADFINSIVPRPTPEPATWLVFAIGTLMITLRLRARLRASSAQPPSGNFS